MSQSEPDIRFDWPLYADATFAGLSILVPIPVLDWLSETFFRRRMLTAIARRRGQTMPHEVWSELQREPDGGCLSGCLMLPITATVWILQVIFKKLVYVLTIKEASEKLSYYWQRAFLLDYMMQRGHHTDLASAQTARAAIEQVLKTAGTPLEGLARQIVGNTRNILRALVRARRGRDSASAEAAEAQMRRRWNDVTPHLRALAQRYETTFEQMRAAPAPPA